MSDEASHPSPAEPAPWPPIRALEASGPPTDRRAPLAPRRIIAAALLALGLGALLSSGALVGLAERQEVGAQRDIALGAAEATDRLAHLLSLNRPAERLAAAFGDEPRIYDVEALLEQAVAPPEVPAPPGGPVGGAAPTGEETPEGPVGDAAADDGEAPEGPSDPGAPPGDGGSGPAATDTAEFDPAEGPPPDGLITPIPGVDCVEVAQAPEDQPDTAAPVDPGPDTAAPVDPGADPTDCPPGQAPVTAPTGPTSTPTAPITAPAPSPADTAVAPAPAAFEAPPSPGDGSVLHIYVGGDSISRDLGEGLARITSAATADIDLDPRPATGLSRPDFFDWSQHLAGVLTESSPDVIVLLFGANDFQNVEYEGRVLDRDDDDWLDLYRQRVRRIMTLVSQPGVQTVWVGQPPVRGSRLSGGLARLNEVYESEAAAHRQVTFVDTWALFSNADGGYAEEIDGVRVRRDDGVHLTIAGGDRLAAAIWEVIASAWDLIGPAQ